MNKKNDKRWTIGMRDAFADTIYEIAKKDKNVVLITADTGAICHDDFRKNLPAQYINVGIAEQNMIGIAAGLALSGKIVYTYAIITFATMRCYEQIRVDLCCMNLPVTVVGVGAGFDYNTLGPTHHGTEDIALMKALPNMTIFSPSDSIVANAVAKISYKIPGPKYIRLDRTGHPLIYSNENEDFSAGLKVLKEGEDIFIIATGRMVYRALEVAEKLSKLSIDTGVIDLYRIKPINTELLLDTIKQTKHIATLEEHFLTGGLGSTIAEILMEKNKSYKFVRFGISDEFCHQYGTRDNLHKLYNLDTDSLTRILSEWISK